MPMLKVVQIQEGSLWGGFYASRASIWGLFDALAVVRRVLAPFIDAVPSLPFNCYFSLEVFMSGQLQMKCSGLLQQLQCFSSAWASFTALAKHTINSSITPSILLGSSLSWPSSSPASSSSKCAKCITGFFRMGWLPLSFLRGKKLVALALGGLSVA